MNRREMLKLAAVNSAFFVMPELFALHSPERKWFTHKQIMHLFNQLDGKTTRETVIMDNPIHWDGKLLELYETVYLAIMRMCNIMHRKTLDNQSKHWLLVSSNMCKVSGIWYPSVFGKYSTPGKSDGVWIKQNWRDSIQEEVSPGIYRVGTLNCKWTFYVDEKFVDNKIMLGMGYKQVIHFRKEGMKQYSWGEYPNLVPYLDKPTKQNYAIITLARNNNAI